MFRPQRIPIVSLVLSMACNNQPEGAVTDGATGTTTDTTTTGGLGASETGVVTTGGADGSGEASSTGAATSTGAFMGDSTGTGTSTGSDTGSSSGSSTGESCEDRDPPDVPAPTHECDPEPCAMGEICLRTLSCHTLYLPCDGKCIVEQDSTHCVPISDYCDPDADDLEYCLEQDFGSFCFYGGYYMDGVLDCYYAFDQCHEGRTFPIPDC